MTTKARSIAIPSTAEAYCVALRHAWSRGALLQTAHWITLLAILVLFPFIAMSSAFADEYRLGPEDKVRLKVYEWRASRDEIFQWTALNDEFTVSEAGTLALPFVGEISAAGKSTGEVARLIAHGLMQQMGLGREPNASVEVVQYRPFYILGDINKPGEFPYRPGLTVLKAVSLASGLLNRPAETFRLQRELIAGSGDLGLYAVNVTSLLARKARLEAELSGAQSIDFPPELSAHSNSAASAVAKQQEQLIFDARRESLSTQTQALQQLRSFLDQEVEAQKQHIDLDDTQIELMQKELQGVSTLVESGLATSPRQMALQRALAQLQGERLTEETSLLRARQEISRTDISLQELQNNRTNEATVALRDTQAQLEDLDQKINTAGKLLRETETTEPRLAALRDSAERAGPTYTIIRQSGDEVTELSATETTPVEPGDTVKVEFPLPNLQDLEQYTSATTGSPDALPLSQ